MMHDRHWAVCKSEVAHSTGPNYIYLWDKATELYVKEADIEVFVQMLQPAVVAMIKATAASGPDCRYVLASKDAFMSRWYKEDPFMSRWYKEDHL
jgi:hypothetical protein